MKILIFIGIFISSLVVFGQENHKKADKLFEKMWYKEAAKEYEAIIKKGDYSMDVLRKIADAYYFNTDMENACKWYESLISEYPSKIDLEYLFKYANSLAGIGNYKKSKKWMQQFTQNTSQQDSRVKRFNQETNPIENILEKPPEFELKNLSLNTPYSDFGPSFYETKLVYASAQDTSLVHTRKYHWNEQPYLDLYIGSINPLKTDARKIGEFSKDINTKFHEAGAAFSSDYEKIYFSRNNYNGSLKRDESGTSHIKLFSANIDKSDSLKIKCMDIKELPFNGETYSIGQPAVSPDGKKLYFVSDMPGSIGATDIFVVDILDNGTYTEPKNLGPKINTSAREMFPYITETTLYFASDGHQGLGGLDVFESLIESDIFMEPTNLGKPLNSSMDDFGYIVDEDSKKGFVCSNRKSGKGDDDIYSFERLELPCHEYIYGSIIEQKRKIPVEKALVMLYDGERNIVGEALTQINGEFNFEKEFDCNSSYEIKITKEGYKPNSQFVITSDTDQFKNKVTIPLEKELNKLIISENGILKIDIDNIYFDLGKSYIRKDAADELNKVVSLMVEYPEMVIKIEAHTDSRGSDSYNLKLSKRRAKSTAAYIISQGIEKQRIESAIGYGETQLINNCGNGSKCSDKEHDTNRRSEFIIIKM